MRTGRRSQSPITNRKFNMISTHVEQEETMENTIIAREHSFTNKGLKTATNRIIKATEQTAKKADEYITNCHFLFIPLINESTNQVAKHNAVTTILYTTMKFSGI